MRIRAILKKIVKNCVCTEKRPAIDPLSRNGREESSPTRENANLCRDLYDKLNRFAAISGFTNSITKIQNDKELLCIILDKSAELLKADQGSLMVCDQESCVLHVEAKKGIAERVPDGVRIRRGEGIAGKVMQSAEPLLVQDIETDPRTGRKNRPHYKTKSFMSVPIMIEDRVIGVLNLGDKSDGQVFTEDDLKFIQSVLTQAAVVMDRRAFCSRNEELKRLSITDPLTGLLNRRYFQERLRDEMARSKRNGHELSLLMLDLDGFKSCNDSRGHIFGDQTLILIGQTLLNSVRSMDVVARFGGDEFIIILPETGESRAVEIAERVRTAVKEKCFLSPSQEAMSGTISTSIGLVSFPRHGETIETLLENADRALYRAKSNGKNRLEVFTNC